MDNRGPLGGKSEPEVELSSRDRLRDWLDGYEQAWRSPGTVGLRELFTDDATYITAPYRDPYEGLPAIAELWEDERDGPGEAFTMSSVIVAVDGDIAVVRVDVTYGKPASHEYRDLWLIEFASDGRCRAFEEWPFFPGQPLSSRREG